jgi:hypothetical protein
MRSRNAFYFSAKLARSLSRGVHWRFPLLWANETGRNHSRADSRCHAADDLSGSRQPRGFGLVVRESGGGFQSVLGRVQNQIPFVIFLTRVQGAKWNGNILFAHTQKSADANDQGRDMTFLVDKNVIDVADLLSDGS